LNLHPVSSNCSKILEPIFIVKECRRRTRTKTRTRTGTKPRTRTGTRRENEKFNLGFPLNLQGWFSDLDIQL